MNLDKLSIAYSVLKLLAVSSCLAVSLSARQVTAGGVSVDWDLRYDSAVSSYDVATDTVVGSSRAFVTGYSVDTADGRYVTQAYDINSGALLWQAVCEEGMSYFTGGIALSPDESQVYVAGNNEQLPGGGTPIGFGSSTLLVAYSAATGVELWRAEYFSPSGSQGAVKAIAVDSTTGRIFVTGSESNSTGSSSDVLTIAYEPTTGVELWVSHYDSNVGTTNDTSNNIVVQPNHSRLFVTGSGGGNFLTLAYDANTGAELWDHIGAQGTGNVIDVSDTVHRLVVSGRGINGGVDTYGFNASNGQVSFELSLFNGAGAAGTGAGGLQVSSDASNFWICGTFDNGGTADIDLRTYAFSGLVGDLIWQQDYDADLFGTVDYRDTATGLVVDESNDVIVVAGYSRSNGVRNTTLVGYQKSNGAQLWFDHGTSSTREVNDIALSADGSRVVAAINSAVVFNSNDYAVLSYETATGAVDWSRSYNGMGSGDDRLNAGALSPDGKTMYVGGNTTGNGNWAEIVAIDTEDQSVIWTARMSAASIYTQGGGVREIKLSPDGGLIYVQLTGVVESAVAALAAVDGSLLWRHDLPGRTDLNGLQHGEILSLRSDNGLLCTAYGDGDFQTVAIHPLTGNISWQSSLDAYGFEDIPQSVMFAPDGQTVFVTGASRFGAIVQYEMTTVAYSALDGVELWRVSEGINNLSALGSDLVVSAAGDVVYQMAQTGVLFTNPVTTRVTAYDASSGSELWQSDVPGSGSDIELSNSGSRVYTTGGGVDLTAHALDSSDGAILWSHTFDHGDRDRGFDISVDDDDLTIYITGATDMTMTGGGLSTIFRYGDAVVLGLDSQSGSELWSMELGTSGTTEDRGSVVIPDGSAKLIYAVGYSNEGGSGDGYVLALNRPSLVSGSETLALQFGGMQALGLRADPERAANFYWMFPSISGTTPGIDFGAFILPLNFGPLFQFALNHPFAGAFGNYIGLLDADGQSSASLTLPAGLDPVLAGTVIHHAYLTAEVFGQPTFASNAVGITLIP